VIFRERLFVEDHLRWVCEALRQRFSKLMWWIQTDIEVLNLEALAREIYEILISDNKSSTHGARCLVGGDLPFVRFLLSHRTLCVDMNGMPP